MGGILYRDTRGSSDVARTFTDTVLAGIAPGGGLYVPESLPSIGLAEIVGFADLTYAQRAARLYRHFGVDVAEGRVADLMDAAYGPAFDHPAVAPVVEAAPDMHVLELWHGPTSAFKDMALQCMPLFFSEAVSMRRAAGEAWEDYLILVATSGDTGKAALEGFADRAHVRIVVFYPAAGVSELQRKQMVTQHGGNLAVFGVRGDFDDCQNAVKAVFADEDFGRRIALERALRLSSANSINWGRLLPQVVYYVSGYADMVAAGVVVPGGAIDVCVPTGNFGNILAAYYARRIGVPIGRLLCASNENSVLADFIASGVYDISDRTLVATPSPSMDILVSSNLERLLFELVRDPAAITGLMRQLAHDRRFKVDRATFSALRDAFSGDWVTNDDSLHVIRRVWEEHGYLLDPHTAVAWEVAERLRGSDPVLVVSTAHWAKFGADVFRALEGIPYVDPLPTDAAGMSPVHLLHRIAEKAEGASAIPAALAALDGLDERFLDIVDAGRDEVEAALLGWLS